ncbi:MAG: hypothetical protein COU67_02770 [Candidatus Pacebacteria bacterium CG10_big_fil_rev_8_21_14_0_10_44_54]|nr:phospholipid carrier-dependent glycosyltransferase [Candidatus Paceibacterota bacterium]PIR60285.1 MAG: hypothetical protein COU67_02770 [Candidatus Pacebacteria bacterium CG10_big_fil_rev_8_21_14_0_10_44_54]
MRGRFFLLVILIFALFVRVFHLDSLPSILNRDEAALAYNGYLLSETGKDEWGRTWPLALESFGDFKLLGYPAVLAVLFKIFPESDFWVRIPSALSGVGLVFLAYQFGLALGFKKKSAVLLAASVASAPVFIFYSRIAFEANLALFLFVASLLLLLKNSKKPTRGRVTLALLTYLAAVCTYNTPLLLGVLVAPIVLFIAGMQNVKKSLVLFLGWIVVTSLAFFVLQPVFAQKQNITLFSDEASVLAFNQYRSDLPEPLQRVIGNKLVYFTPQIVKNAVRAFSPRFLVTQGGSHPWHSIAGRGHIYWWQYLAAACGVLLAITHVVKKRPQYQGPLLLLILLLLSLVPASITTDAPHATRSLLFFFILLVFGAWAYDKYSKILGRRDLYIGMFILLISQLLYVREYFFSYKQNQAMFQPGFAQELTLVQEQYPNKSVAVVDGGGYQYILAAWYARLSPSQYFSSVVRQAPDQIGFRYGQQVGNFHFIAQAQDRTDETVLIEWQDGMWVTTKF